MQACLKRLQPISSTSFAYQLSPLNQNRYWYNSVYLGHHDKLKKVERGDVIVLQVHEIGILIGVFTLLLSAKRYRSVSCRTTRLHSSLIPQAERLWDSSPEPIWSFCFISLFIFLIYLTIKQVISVCDLHFSRFLKIHSSDLFHIEVEDDPRKCSVVQFEFDAVFFIWLSFCCTILVA